MNIQTEINQSTDIRKGMLDNLSYKILKIANIIMLLTIVFHDADHVRQAMGWGYKIGISLWVINCSVYIPSLVAFLLTRQRRRSAAIVTCIGGLNVAIAFAKIHFLGSAVGIWGPWNKSFFVLGADAISWSVLAFTIVVGVGVSIAGAYVIGRLSATA